MKELTIIANECNTDKGTVKDECHGFSEFYNNIFDEIRQKAITENQKVNILEIGVQYGPSLEMFNKFFNYNCNIYGCDINIGQNMYTAPNVYTYQLDANSKDSINGFLNQIGNIKFDIILDDASHISAHQIHTLLYLYKNIKEDGIYVLEDLHCGLHERTDSPLYYLMFNNKLSFMTDRENEELKKIIHDIEIYCHYNEKSNFEKKSITSIIRFNKIEIHELKVALCCICKNENNYIREWVEYYKNLGFDNIIIYDNNDIEGEHIEDVISDYINSGFVIVNNVRGKAIYQLPAYNDCIVNYGKQYDWIAFFDCDEFLCLTKKTNIKDYISEFPDECDRIAINWMTMDDNDMIENDGRPVMERLTRACPIDVTWEYSSKLENSHVKTILKCGKLEGRKFVNPHFCTGIKCSLNNKGENINSLSPFVIPVNWDNAYLKHFRLKTITEYLYNKILKGAPDVNYKAFRSGRCTPDKFFRINKRTPEKEQIIKEFIEKKL